VTRVRRLVEEKSGRRSLAAHHVLRAVWGTLVMMLLPKDHYDLTVCLTTSRAEFGRLIVHTARAIESLPNVARAHVSRWGDGGAHLHVFFFARPEGFAQLRGTCFAIWDDLLPPTPRDVRDNDALHVAQVLVTSYGDGLRRRSPRAPGPTQERRQRVLETEMTCFRPASV